MTIERILVPLDGTPFAERAIPAAARLARLGRGSLVLARVEEPAMPMVAGLGEIVMPPLGADDATRRADAAYLERVAEGVRAAGAEARTIVLDGELGPALREACARERIDLVVMVTHGRTGLARLLLGSGAERVVRDGPPVRYST